MDLARPCTRAPQRPSCRIAPRHTMHQLLVYLWPSAHTATAPEFWARESLGTDTSGSLDMWRASRAPREA
eukprot:1788174-Pyramimonas_sp.AAC.1